MSGHRLWKPRRRVEGAPVTPRDPKSPPQTLAEALAAILHWLGRTAVYRSRHFVGDLTVDVYPLREPPRPVDLVQNPHFGRRSIEDAVRSIGALAATRERRALRVFVGDPGPDGKGRRMVLDVYPSRPSAHVALAGAAFPADDWLYQFDLEVLDIDRRGQVD